MPELIYPKKLMRGDMVRVVAPSFSMKMVPKSVLDVAARRFQELGLEVSFGKNTSKFDMFESSSVEDRLEDLMEAFLDKKVKAVLAVMGGYNSNYLLDHINWQVIKDNPKIFCGMSDITVLSNAMLAKTGLVTYSGPNYRNFGQEKYFDFTLENFRKVIFSDKPFTISRSDSWSDDKWSKNQEKRKLIKNTGWWHLSNGEAEGEVVGGNLCSINLLQGTEYMPDIPGKILFLEDDSMSTVGEFSRNWQSLVHLPEFLSIKGVVFGRFQKKTKMSERKLKAMLEMVDGMSGIPVLGNVDFGHTDPKITFPIGGVVRVSVNDRVSQIEILKH